jgi:hypothetical protein
VLLADAYVHGYDRRENERLQDLFCYTFFKSVARRS